MREAVQDFWKNEFWPRKRRIFISAHSGIALAFGVGVAVWGHRFSAKEITTTDLSLALITYAAIALGFSLSGLTLALTLPNQKFARRLVESRVDSGSLNSYSTLIFVFAWTAIVHWLLVVASMCTLILDGGRKPILDLTTNGWKCSAFGLVAALCTYCLLQFLITLITLTQIGRAYLVILAQEKDAELKTIPSDTKPTNSEKSPS